MFTIQLQHLVQQLTHTLSRLTDDEYSRPLAVFNGSSIGQHTRHVIEFFVELEKGYQQGFVDYDNRQRNKTLETDKQSALALLTELAAACNKPDKLLQLSVDFHAAPAAPAMLATTYYRELAFAIEHTVHHMALIRIGIEQVAAFPLPPEFGMAASTQRFQTACAQ